VLYGFLLPEVAMCQWTASIVRLTVLPILMKKIEQVLVFHRVSCGGMA
jgi:hypothetical protein